MLCLPSGSFCWVGCALAHLTQWHCFRHVGISRCPPTDQAEGASDQNILLGHNECSSSGHRKGGHVGEWPWDFEWEVPTVCPALCSLPQSVSCQLGSTVPSLGWRNRLREMKSFLSPQGVPVHHWAVAGSCRGTPELIRLLSQQCHGLLAPAKPA